MLTHLFAAWHKELGSWSMKFLILFWWKQDSQHVLLTMLNSCKSWDLAATSTLLFFVVIILTCILTVTPCLTVSIVSNCYLCYNWWVWLCKSFSYCQPWLKGEPQLNVVDGDLSARSCGSMYGTESSAWVHILTKYIHSNVPNSLGLQIPSSIKSVLEFPSYSM